MNNKSRRYALMSIIGLEKYATVVYNYIYYNLISSYRDSGKMKLAKIEGNGVIENQIIENGNFATTGNWYASVLSTLSISGNVATLTAGSISYDNDVALNNGSIVAGIIGHKYLLKCYIKCSKSVSIRSYYSGQWQNYYSGFSVNANEWKLMAVAFDPSSSNQLLIISPIEDTKLSSGDTFDIKEVNLIDLTLMFGTGNEPTTLTDNRIQNLLNRGYIAYNQGKYKGTNVGEIATEQYNLLSGLELGSIDISTGSSQSSNTQLRTKGYISLIGGNTYSIEYVGSTSSVGVWGFLYDENDNVVDPSTWTAQIEIGNYQKGKCLLNNNFKTNQFTIPNGNYHFRFYLTSEYGITYNNDICFHRTGTRTGYAPHKPSASIPFIYQGNGALNAHDTFEITSSEYVFTKNVVETDLGNYNYNGSNGVFNCDLGNIKTQTNDVVVNALCPLYVPVTRNDFVNNTPNMTMRVDNNQSTPYLYFRNTTYTSSADFKTAMTGTKLRYQLATPQVIRIPRKHLGIVDFGTLTGSYVSNGVYYIYGDAFGFSQASSNNNGYACYVSRFIRANGNEVYSKTNDNTICLTSPFIGNNLAIYSSEFSGKSASEIRALLSGVYLFYETAEEVDDIVYKIKYENGGTITTLEQLLPREYQQVEYIECGNPPYIDTGYKITSNNEKVEIKFSLAYASSINGLTLFGSNDGSNVYSITSYHSNGYGTGVFKHWVGSSNGIAEVTMSETNTNEVTYIAKDGVLTCIVNGITTSSSYIGTVANNANIYIFGKNNAGSSSERRDGYRLYYFKLYDNDIIVRNFIPCYRKADNVVGLYDLVSKQFYTNQGSGAFVKGNDLNEYKDTEVLPNVTMEVQV